MPHRISDSIRDSLTGGMFSVALSIGSRRPDAIWRLALWSPDFPPPAKTGSDCLADSEGKFIIWAQTCKRGLKNIGMDLLDGIVQMRRKTSANRADLIYVAKYRYVWVLTISSLV